MSLRFAAIGLDHRHIYEQVGRLLELGCECVGYWTEGEPQPLEGFIKRFPHIPRLHDRRRLLEDPTIALVVTAAIPRDRAELAITAMDHGKDVMTDKPGCTSLAQLDAIRAAVARTGRIWSVSYSERFEVRAVTRALELVRAGAIGRVVQTIGLGPHRLNRPLRPAWFFDPSATGGILTDIGCHQIDQFLVFTGSTDAEIVSASTANFANPGQPGFEDWAELVLKSPQGRGYVQLDWYTPDGLPNWGDGRLKLLGTEGYIELRKYVDPAGRPGTDHLFLVDGEATRYIDCADAPLPYYGDLVQDVLTRGSRAMDQAHCFKVMELALKAQLTAGPAPG
jgi:predicted dehydrogenase